MPQSPWSHWQPPYAPVDPSQGWLWRPDQAVKVPGLRSPDAYRLQPDPHLGSRVHLSPAAVLGTQDLECSDNQLRYSAAQQAYVRSSLDVTMKGGIASGVIYPLALCELARHFRLRNIGGASAGAIAAALAAAAELGRAKQALEPASSGPDPAPAGAPRDTPADTADDEPQAVMTQPPPTDVAGQQPGSASQDTGHRGGRAGDGKRPLSEPQPDPAVGPGERCDQGFKGLADIIAWLTQLDSPNESTEEYRTAQLFKPTPSAVRIFRVVAAILRRRFWTLPLLAATSFGPAKRIISLIFLTVLPFLVYGLASAASPVPAPVAWYHAVLVAAGCLLALSLLAFGLLTGGGLLMIYIGRRRRQSMPRPEPLGTPWVSPPDSSSNRDPYLYLGLAVVGLAALVIIASTSPAWLWLGPSRLLLVWVLGVLIMITTTGVSIAQLIGDARSAHYGLITGLTDLKASKRLGNALSRAVGLPNATVSTNINDWLDQRLRELAGVSEVLTFGDLWCLPSHNGHTDTTTERMAASKDPSRRLVNLELMTTDLVHRVPYRFPLADQELGLLVRRSDLVTLFSKCVVDALCTKPLEGEFRDVDSGDTVTDLYELPDSSDLPVVFAVRISLAFPSLFTAVRLYRVAAGKDDYFPHVRNEYGQMIRGESGLATYPARASQPAQSPTWVQELWLSDGGIASNFPIHFFDAVLPRWPTVGINLGPYPAGFGHQDVYLPTDQQATNGVPAPLSRSLVSFLSAVFDTARNWRDTAQTLMPATRGRIAWVRQSSSEGGANLFMTRQTVASLALRGAVAGARLRRRFASQGQWRRHQWLRLRVAGDNLAELRKRLTRATYERFYADLCSGTDAASVTFGSVVQALAREADPTLPGRNPFLAAEAAPAPDPSAVAEALTAASADGQPPDPTNPPAEESVYNWYEPKLASPAELWDAVHTLVEPFLTDLPTSELSDNVPTPAAELRQVPSP